jgi:uncharacterized membrane protein
MEIDMRASLALTAALFGAAGMFLLDPTEGRRRRAVLRDRVAHGAARLTTREVSDAVLLDRVRTRLGRVVSVPHAVAVSARDGAVTLTGTVSPHEHGRLVLAASLVPGVVDVVDHLESRVELGAGERGRSRDVFMPHRWSTRARTLAAGLGGALVLFALIDRRARSFIPAAAGTALIARSATNRPMRQLLRVRGPRFLDVHKTIHIKAPVERVFETLSHYERFPQLLNHVRDIFLREDGSSHWSVAGPGGRIIEWNAVTTRSEPGRLLAWRALPGSQVEHSGVIRFEPVDGGTRISATTSYRQPGGPFGRLIARLLDADPRSRLEQDLARLKVFLETEGPSSVSE